MGTLAELNAGQTAVVTKVEATGELKQRLFSFGLRKGSVLKIKATSIARSTMEIEIGSTLLALRYEEAKYIQVSEQ
ncbi:MAG: FeoA family protein [Sulfurospirillaceae bacterium]|jgi:ferrous iron transport protein A|nr:FeoA family protein [Sulfurospirillaceae bacterium]MDD2825644.1 FeoA family protein [Sulfurospirillaceae bacterium]